MTETRTSPPLTASGGRVVVAVSGYDPRAPKRPDGEAGASWAVCRDCGREAARLKDIRHRKNCKWRSQ